MKPLVKVALWPEGWIVVDCTHDAAEPTAEFHPTRESAQHEADAINASWAAWNARGLSDAPHLD